MQADRNSAPFYGKFCRIARNQKVSGIRLGQELNKNECTLCLFCGQIHKRVSERNPKSSFSVPFVLRQHILSTVRQVINREIVASSRCIGCWFVESLGCFRIPHFGAGTSIFGAVVFSFRVKILIEFMGARARIFPNCGFFIKILFSDWSHCPFRGRINSKLVVSSSPRELDPVKLDITARCCFLGYFEKVHRGQCGKSCLWDAFYWYRQKCLFDSDLGMAIYYGDAFHGQGQSFFRIRSLSSESFCNLPAHICYRNRAWEQWTGQFC